MDTVASQTERPRRRDAAATRRSLLAAARTLMAAHGVEGTSTRDVAAAAGVNQALVYRYFGSKEKLFAEAAGSDAAGADDLVTDTPLEDLPRALLDRALDISAETGHDASFSALISAANDTTVRDIIRERIDTGFRTQLATRLDGDDTELRAELLAALITGISVLREKIGTRALAAADREALGDWVDRMTAVLLHSD